MILDGDSRRKLDDALADALVGWDAYAGIFSRIGVRLTEVVAASANDVDIRSRVIEWAETSDRLAEFIGAAQQMSTNQQLLAIDVTQLVCVSRAACRSPITDPMISPAIRDVTPEQVLRRSLLSGGFFLVNRETLRASYRQMLPPTGNRVLIVRGDDESGLSHSAQILYDLREACRRDPRQFEIAEINLESRCRALGPRRTFNPRSLAAEFIRALGYGDPAQLPDREDKQWSAWIRDFVDDTFEPLAEADQRRIYLVVDAINRVRLSQPSADLLADLIISIGTKLPHFRLILLGYGAEIPRRVRQAALVDQTCEITELDVAKFFVKAYQEAAVAIGADEVVEKVNYVMAGRASAPPGTLLDLADRVRDRLPRAATDDE